MDPAGAFRAHLGVTPESLIGRDACEIVAPEDRVAFVTAISLLGARGRVTPTALRLANAAHTPFALSGLGLEVPGQTRRYCICFALMPAPFEMRAPTVQEAPVSSTESRPAALSSGEDVDWAMIAEQVGPAWWRSRSPPAAAPARAPA